MLLHGGAGLGTPTEGCVPQKRQLLWLSLGTPSPAAVSVMVHYVDVPVTVFNTPESHMWGRRCSKSSLHLAARASPVSVEQQGPAPGRGRGPGGMLWPRAAAGVSDGAATPVS